MERLEREPHRRTWRHAARGRACGAIHAAPSQAPQGKLGSNRPRLQQSSHAGRLYYRSGRDVLHYSRNALQIVPRGAERQTMKKAANAMSKKEREELATIPDPANGEEFDALSDADKEKIYRYYDTHPKLTGLRKPTKAQQKVIDAQVAAERKKRGRPILGEGSRQIAVTIEAGLLRRVDKYAKENGMKRAQLIAHSLRKVLADPRKSA